MSSISSPALGFSRLGAVPGYVSPISKKSLLVGGLVLGWLLTAGWGMWRLAAYSFAPGAQGVAPARWPASSQLARNPHGLTAVLALHPECPCSEATLEELDSILAQGGGRLEARLLFVGLPGLPAAENSALWRRARRMKGLTLVKDEDGAEARRFDARTSGELRLYGPGGELLFHGGITGSRGHAGDNPGEAAVVALLRDPPGSRPPGSAPVFGCALWDATLVPRR